ncbi:hypothetical protein RJ640_018732 [Escallonia rubra]|uniref:Uncharacterized protein n=1 Tax=Escallonia rubra TaxID=112253 RepID=A0AA88U1R9_9ASTE|nr:hypothetical protein RJ640_018732 [Escallonia rubra]
MDNEVWWLWAYIVVRCRPLERVSRGRGVNNDDDQGIFSHSCSRRDPTEAAAGRASCLKLIIHIAVHGSLPAAMLSGFLGRGSCHLLCYGQWRRGLSTMGLSGTLSGDIGGLTGLISMDLSYNKGLTSSLSPQLGDLKNLRILALNTNNFTGGIPPSLGRLSNLYWLDLAENQLTGSLPVSNMDATVPGLDLLKKAKHLIWVPSRAVATDSLQFPTDPTSVSSNISTEDHASS